VFARSHRLATAALAIAIAAPIAATTQVTATAAAPAAKADTVTVTAAERSVARFERWATITRIKNGYYYDAGQQDTQLTVTRVAGGVRFADTRTDVIRSKPDSCRKKPAQVGSVVVCRVGNSVSARRPMTVKVFTRLGDDYINTTALPAAFELYMLADAGRDVVRAGAGDDFINGAQQRDRVWGGAGNDWIRTGLGNDYISGGPGRDRLVGVEGDDTIHGGNGNDRIGGGPGRDRLNAKAGKDHVLCGTGRDRARADRSDTINRDCETVNFG